MSWADIAIVSIIGISALISVFRGLVREVLSLLAWVLAFYVGFRFNQPLAEAFSGFISVSPVRTSAAFLLLFFGVLLLMGLMNWLILKAMESTGLSGTDRALGVVFGTARGIAIVTVLVLLLGLSDAPRDPWWQQSLFLPHFERLALQASALLPPELGQRVRY